MSKRPHATVKTVKTVKYNFKINRHTQYSTFNLVYSFTQTIKNKSNKSFWLSWRTSANSQFSVKYSFKSPILPKQTRTCATSARPWYHEKITSPSSITWKWQNFSYHVQFFQSSNFCNHVQYLSLTNALSLLHLQSCAIITKPTHSCAKLPSLPLLCACLP